VDFLEVNPGYATCCHRVLIKKGNRKPRVDDKDIYAPATEATYDIEMMARHGNLIATPSVVFRSHLFSSFPAWFGQAPVADYVLHMLNAQYGKTRYFPEPMAVYRDHVKGVWGGASVRANAAGMIKLVNFLLGEPFNEAVKKGLREQLLGHKVTYLYELLREDEDLFRTEFTAMTEADKSVALALVEKMKNEEETFRRSRTYKALHKLRRITKI